MAAFEVLEKSKAEMRGRGQRSRGKAAEQCESEGRGVCIKREIRVMWEQGGGVREGWGRRMGGGILAVDAREGKGA